MNFSLLNLSLLVVATAVAQDTNAPTSLPSASDAASDPIEEVVLDLANGFFLREFYDLALIEYEKYLAWFPDGPAAEEAMYRIAECYRGLGKPDVAREKHQATQKAFPNGSFYARASFHLGEIEWKEGRFENALRFYREAAKRAESPATRLAAHFCQVRALIQLKKNSEAVPALQDLAETEKENPYRGFALLELARLAEAAGQEAEARVLFTTAVDTDSSFLLRAEAGMKAGALAMKARQWAAALKILEKTRKIDPSGDWVPHANLNIARCHYQSDQYERALAHATDPKNRFPKGSEAELILLQSHALRLLKKYTEAARSYEQFLKDHPRHPAAESAAYERLICLAALDAKTWETEAAVFLKDRANAPVVPRIWRLRADRAFRRKDYAGAADAYARIVPEKLEVAIAPEILYRHGYSLAQTGAHEEAAKRFDEFVRRFPDHELAAGALFQKGLAEQQTGKPQDAIGSFSRIVERFVKSAEHEPALYHVALLQGELKKYDAMRAAFEQLSRDHPRSRFIQDAGYWTGWSFFEEKKYAEALPFLVHARKADPGAYGAQATSRIILANFHLEKRIELLKEADAMPARAEHLAPEIHDWLADESAKAGDHAAAERHYRKLIGHSAAAGWRQSARWGLAQNLAAQSKWKEAIETWESYQKDYSGPADSMLAKLELIRAYAAAKQYARSQEVAEEVMSLQREGRNNAQARFRLGEALSDQKKFAEAGKYFLSVAILYDDPELTPRALSRAAQAFESAGETHQALKLRRELKEKYPVYK